MWYDGEGKADINAHIESCNACQEKVALYTRIDAAVKEGYCDDQFATCRVDS